MILTTTRKFLTALAACLLSGSVQAAPVLWSSASGGNDHYYDFIAVDSFWQDAFLGAQAIVPPVGYQTGHLLTISNASEEQFVLSNWTSEAGWMGFTDAVTEGEWHWIDSTPGIWQDPDNFPAPIQTAYTSWGGIEPNNLYTHTFNFTGEDYAIFNSGGIGLKEWNDGVGPDVGSKFKYFVEFEPTPIPEPSSMIALLATFAFLGIGFHRRIVGTTTRMSLIAILGVLLIATSTQAQTVSFGSGLNQFNMEFVEIGSPGNAADTTGNPNPDGRGGSRRQLTFEKLFVWETVGSSSRFPGRGENSPHEP